MLKETVKAYFKVFHQRWTEGLRKNVKCKVLSMSKLDTRTAYWRDMAIGQLTGQAIRHTLRTQRNVNSGLSDLVAWNS
jgi:hypothetical protein